MKPSPFIFIGRSGAGKGTQADLLIAELKKSDPTRDVLYLQSGGELRNFIKGPSYTAALTKKMLDEGGLLPEFMPIYLWGNVFTERYHGTEHIVLDGTPRKLMEAQILESLISFFDLDKPYIIYLDVDHHESTKRLLKRGRNDDREHEIKKRMEWFDADVLPVVEYYHNNPNYNFLDIEGEASIEDVHAEIMHKIGLKK